MTDVSASRGRAVAPALAWAVIVAAALPGGVAAQNAGSILGRVVDATSGEAREGALLTVDGTELRTSSATDGRFIVVAVPFGERSLTVELIGYATTTVEGIQVRPGQPARVTVALAREALELDEVRVEVERVRLVEPEISATHELIQARELRELPIDEVSQAIELAPGVSDGHFRGGRIGQEAYVVDGLEFKNQFEASSQGPALEHPADALEEIEVVTGGLGARFGSALSGVVRYTTRRGDAEQWRGAATVRTDQWAPDPLFRGFSALTASAGGPAPMLGRGSVVFASVLAQGMMDAEPRARGLTCLRPGDGDAEMDALIDRVATDPATAGLACPYSAAAFPHQTGDKLLAFARVDRPIAAGLALTTTLLHNRVQSGLYTSEFKYNPDYQLGQRSDGTLATASLDWARQELGGGAHVTLQGSAMRLDRYLGVVDPRSRADRRTIAGFGPGRFAFLGEDFVRSPVAEQLSSGSPVPGYVLPGGSVGSPFGPAAEGIFFTAGTPGIANWTRTEFVGGDLSGELLSSAGHILGAGAGAKLYRVESYERGRSYLAGSAPNYALFYPGSVSAFVDVRLAAADEITVTFGGRVDAFRAGLDYRQDRVDFLASGTRAGWKIGITPRIGMSGPVPGTDGAMSFRFNYSQVAQPPDFRFFLDTTLGDSLRTDIRRQGNPDLAFEKGTSYEFGLTRQIGESAGVSLVGFRKELNNLVTGSLRFAGFSKGQFTAGDFGTVQGAEMSVRARWPLMRLRFGYSLQKAVGVVSTALDPEIADADAGREEYPLAFDRRHSANLAVFAGRSAGDTGRGWGVTLAAAAKSGYPLDRQLLDPGREPEETGPERARFLPWIVQLDLRASLELGAMPGCSQCRWRIVADGRNLLDRHNVLALRRDTGTLAPPAAQVFELARGGLERSIPRESPRYSAHADLDRNGRITDLEYRTVRLAAALDRMDPSLFFDEPLQLRLGAEVSFR